MQKTIVDQQQKAVTVGAFPLALEDPGACIMFARAALGVDLKDLEMSMDAVIKDVQDNLISEIEFQKLLNQVESDFVTANTSVAGIAESLANYEMYFGDANLINTELERYRKVTREDIKNVANKYFNKNSRVVLYWLPQGAKP
jgi:predicted Zn-dependent peptidase